MDSVSNPSYNAMKRYLWAKMVDDKSQLSLIKHELREMTKIDQEAFSLAYSTITMFAKRARFNSFTWQVLNSSLLGQVDEQDLKLALLLEFSIRTDKGMNQQNEAYDLLSFLPYPGELNKFLSYCRYGSGNKEPLLPQLLSYAKSLRSRDGRD